MIFSADSSFVVRLYDPETEPKELAKIRDYLIDDQKLVTISELARVEVLNVLLRRPKSGAVEQFEADLLSGERIQTASLDWPATLRQAESLARRFSGVLKPGGHDLMLVAAAVVMGATWFLSFDRNSRQRALAAAAGLKVWPPLQKDEKGFSRRTAGGQKLQNGR